ncbi:glycosyltransferase [Virgibacillus oceani]|uniref:Glycosyl transferase n=1 Tax=Virgibacillus oceani TaxID=1479511 RepID=A0A917HDK3_9BACI|nr:glycosyltransferase [Virgibacillus oceani]GGG75541.1 glycosyl transferase [Virgibacillus oceani]
MRNKKVCMVVAHHPFMDARIFSKEAKSLQKTGYHVTMIVPRINGNLFNIDGTPYKSQFRNKVFTHEGIKFITYNWETCKNHLNKVVNDESTWEKQGFKNPLTRLAIEEDADIYHTHEYLSLFAGVGIKRLMKKQKNKDVKLIYDSHELTPDPLDPRYSEERRHLLKQKLLTMLKETDYVITVSDSIKGWYLSQMPELPVEVIYNSPPLAKNYQPKTFHNNGIMIGYEGNFDDKKGCKEKIIDIAEICSKSLEFRFKVIGGSRFGNSFSIPAHLRNTIKLTGWVDYNTLPAHLKDVDIGWVDMDNLEHSLNRNYAMPNKFFSYLNNGIPVLANKSHDIEKFIQTHKCGVVIDKTNVSAEEYAAAIKNILKDKNQFKLMSENGRKAMENLYSWEKMEQRLFQVYDQL